jgi:hypothetical protein
MEPDSLGWAAMFLAKKKEKRKNEREKTVCYNSFKFNDEICQSYIFIGFSWKILTCYNTNKFFLLIFLLFLFHQRFLQKLLVKYILSQFSLKMSIKNFLSLFLLEITNMIYFVGNAIAIC